MGGQRLKKKRDESRSGQKDAMQLDSLIFYLSSVRSYLYVVGQRVGHAPEPRVGAVRHPLALAPLALAPGRALAGARLEAGRRRGQDRDDGRDGKEKPAETHSTRSVSVESLSTQFKLSDAEIERHLGKSDCAETEKRQPDGRADSALIPSHLNPLLSLKPTHTKRDGLKLLSS